MDKQIKYKKFNTDIDNLTNIFLVEQEKREDKDEQVNLVAR